MSIMEQSGNYHKIVHQGKGKTVFLVKMSRQKVMLYMQQQHGHW